MAGVCCKYIPRDSVSVIIYINDIITEDLWCWFQMSGSNCLWNREEQAHLVKKVSSVGVIFVFH